MDFYIVLVANVLPDWQFFHWRLKVLENNLNKSNGTIKVLENDLNKSNGTIKVG